MSERKNILVISNEIWSNIWFSKHHYAYELSKSHQVFFVNPAPRWEFKNLFSSEISVKSVSASLQVISYRNFLPHYFLKLNNRIVSARLKRFLKKMNFNIDICWTFDPVRLYDMNVLGAKKSIFHVVDKYLFSFKSELILHRNVDGFVVVAEEFRAQYENYHKPILFVPHGVPTDQDEVMEEKLVISHENYVLYMGMIDGRLDYKLILDLVVKFPNEIFLFLGNIGNINGVEFERLFIQKEFKNVIHVPAVHALKLKYYIAKSKFCIAPMLQEWEGNMISHHKIFQYMAHGKPVFSPVFSAYISFKDLLYMNNDKEELMKLISNYIKNGEDQNLASARISLTKENTYESNSRRILEFVKNLN